MRDVKKLYADTYRPPGSTSQPVPALLCWSPFGKKFNGLMSLQLMTLWNVGTLDGTLSSRRLTRLIGCLRAMPLSVNLFSRGSGQSEDVMAIMGTQEAENGYDAIKALARARWCNGSVGLVGISHLVIVQWFIAALNAPVFKAIAPWEGCGDLFREQFSRGDIHAGDLFDKLIAKHMLQGHHGMQSLREMFKQHRLANWWWNGKRPDSKQYHGF